MAFQLRRQAVGHDFLPLHLQRVVAISCALADRDAFRVWSLGGETDEARRRDHPALLRRDREIHAAARVVERLGLRSAGAALPRPHPRRARAALLGHRRRRPRVSLQQLHQPLSHAALRRDGPALAVPGPGGRAARRDRAAPRSARASSAWTARRCGTRSRPGGSRTSGTTARPTSSIPISFSCASRRCAAR